MTAATMLDNSALRDLQEKSGDARRRLQAVAHLSQASEMSERRACRVIGWDQASVRYQATRRDDGDRRERLKALAKERRRFGYCRLDVLLRRERQVVNKKRVQRNYRVKRLTVRRHGGRKRAIGAGRSRRRWRPTSAGALDFVSDQMTDRWRFRIRTVIDNCTRECPA